MGFYDLWRKDPPLDKEAMEKAIKNAERRVQDQLRGLSAGSISIDEVAGMTSQVLGGDPDVVSDDAVTFGLVQINKDDYNYDPVRREWCRKGIVLAPGGQPAPGIAKAPAGIGFAPSFPMSMPSFHIPWSSTVSRWGGLRPLNGGVVVSPKARCTAIEPPTSPNRYGRGCSLPRPHHKYQHAHFEDHDLTKKIDVSWGSGMPVTGLLPLPKTLDTDEPDTQYGGPPPGQTFYAPGLHAGKAPPAIKKYEVGVQMQEDRDCDVPHWLKPSFMGRHRCGIMHDTRLECSLPAGVQHPTNKDGLPVHEAHPFHNLGEPCIVKWVQHPVERIPLHRLFPGWEEPGAHEIDTIPDVTDEEAKTLPTWQDMLKR